MEAQKNKDKVFEIRDDFIRAAIFFYNVTKITLGEELPKIRVVDLSQKGAIGLHSGNTISIDKELENYGKKIFEGTVAHEFYHWAILSSGLRSNFEGGFDMRSYIEHGDNYLIPLRPLLIKYLPQPFLRINSIEEGAAEFFAAKFISKNENEIPINIFYTYFYENPSTVSQVRLDSIYYKKAKEVIKEVYTTYQKLNGLQPIETIDEPLKKAEFQINELIDKCYRIVPYSIKWYALHNIGRATVLFAYEIYKKENKNSEQLLKDLTLYPWETVEKVVREIKNDKNGELLKNTFSDLSEGFKEHLRGEEEKSSFIQKLVTKVEEFKKRIRS